jgi:hypothetical protein
MFQPEDFGPDFDRAHHADDKLAEFFKDVVIYAMKLLFRCREEGERLATLCQTLSFSRVRQVRDLMPSLNFIAEQYIGTGKTTTARKMGQVYFDVGLLARPTIHECSASGTSPINMLAHWPACPENF